MQQFIKAILKTLKAVCNYIEEAYEMTYKETSRDFHKEVKKRQKENKEEFLSRAQDFVKEKFERETGIKMPDSVAYDFAQAFFRVGKQKGDINFLNRLDINEKE
jgi:hypothetical protein